MRDQIKLLCTYFCRQNELYAALAKRQGISYNTLLTLYAIDQDQGSTQSQLANIWLIPKQTLNTVIRSLMEKGYVTLKAGQNQKEKLVYFTQTGQEYASRVLQDVYRMEDRAIAQIGTQQFLRMVEITRDFTLAFEQEVNHDQ